jgi:hypothetical protein
LNAFIDAVEKGNTTADPAEASVRTNEKEGCSQITDNFVDDGIAWLGVSHEAGLKAGGYTASTLLINAENALDVEEGESVKAEPDSNSTLTS